MPYVSRMSRQAVRASGPPPSGLQSRPQRRAGFRVPIRRGNRPFAIALMLVLTWCGAASAQRSSSSITVRERWCTGGNPAAHEFLSVTGAGELSSGLLWVSDGRAGAIYEVSPSGKVAEVVVPTGDGPGEVRGPYGYVRWPDGIFGVYDAFHASFELFAPTGRFTRRMRLSERPTNVKGIAALPDRGLLMSGGIAGNPSSIHVFDSAGTLVRSFHPAPVTKNPRAGIMVAGGPVAVEPGGTVWFSQAAPHAIFRLDIARGTMERFSADPALLPTIGDDFISETTENGKFSRTFKWFFPQSRAVLPLGDRLVNIVVRHDEDETLWELYDIRTRRRLSMSRVPSAYLPLGRTRDGDVLATRDDKETGQALLCRLQMTQ